MSPKETVRELPQAEGSPEISIEFSPHEEPYSYNVGETTYAPSGVYFTHTGETVTFTATVTFPNAKRYAIGYEWDMGDGIIEYGNPATHVYTFPSEHYQVSLTVTDNFGKEWRARRSMYVQQPWSPFKEAVLALEPALFYAPSLGSSGTTVSDLSGNSRNGTLVNGASFTNGLVDGGSSVALDGVNDYIDTGWQTRTNLCHNPLHHWAANFISNITLVAFDEAGPNGWPNHAEVQGNGVVGNQQANFDPSANTEAGGWGSQVPVVPGEKITAQIEVAATKADLSAGQANLTLSWRKADRSFLTSTTSATIWEGGTYSVTGTAPAEAAFVVIEFIFHVTSGTTGTVKAEWRHCIAERGESVGSFFPEAADLESGLAGWSGAEHLSESDIGPFARGTARTYVGLVNVTTYSGRANSLFGEDPTGNSKALGCFTNTEGHVTFRLGNGETFTDYNLGSLGAAGATHALAVVRDASAKTAQAYVDGAANAQVTGMNQAYNVYGTSIRVGGALGSRLLGSALPFAVFTKALTSEQISTLYNESV